MLLIAAAILLIAVLLLITTPKNNEKEINAKDSKVATFSAKASAELSDYEHLFGEPFSKN